MELGSTDEKWMGLGWYLYKKNSRAHILQKLILGQSVSREREATLANFSKFVKTRLWQKAKKTKLVNPIHTRRAAALTQKYL